MLVRMKYRRLLGLREVCGFCQVTVLSFFFWEAAFWLSFSFYFFIFYIYFFKFLADGVYVQKSSCLRSSKKKKKKPFKAEIITRNIIYSSTYFTCPIYIQDALFLFPPPPPPTRARAGQGTVTYILTYLFFRTERQTPPPKKKPPSQGGIQTNFRNPKHRRKKIK